MTLLPPFYSVAVDAAGNRETLPAAADLEVAVPVVLQVVQSQPLTVEWATAPDVAYAVERTGSIEPGASWTRIAGPVMGVNGVATFSDSETHERAYYRVRTC